MTLAEIMRLALRQLDEDPADISEFADLFRQYANLGYKLLVSRYYKPRDTFTLRTDKTGSASIEGMGIDYIASLRDAHDRDVHFHISADGERIETLRREEDLTAVCVLELPELKADTDVPRIPEYAHHALVDYVCYRYLSTGNAAKQSRAMLFYQQFEQTARTIKPQGSGSVIHMRSLYAATDIRNVGW